MPTDGAALGRVCDQQGYPTNLFEPYLRNFNFTIQVASLGVSMGPRVPLGLVSGSPKVSKMLSPLEMYFQFPSGRFISLPEQYVCREERYGTFPSRHRQGREPATLFSQFLTLYQTCSLLLQQQLVFSRLCSLIPWIHSCSGFREFFARTLWGSAVLGMVPSP